MQVVELELMKLPGVAGLVKEACATVQRNAESEIEEIFGRFKVRAAAAAHAHAAAHAAAAETKTPCCRASVSTF